MNDSTSSQKNQPVLDFKSATLYAVRVVLHSDDTASLISALSTRMNDAGAFFENEAVVVDASQLDTVVDWTTLVEALKKHNLHPVGVVAQGANLEAAAAAGLAAVDLSNPVPRPKPTPAPESDMPVVAAPRSGAADSAAAPAEAQGKAKKTGGGKRGASGAGTAKSASDAVATQPDGALPEIAPAALVINRPLRSGQRIYARNTDLIVIGVVSQGAEVIADGNIHVYGPLRGKAMAGARGDTSARIFTTQLDPELLAIAGVYRVIETRLDSSMHNRPAIIQLDEDRLQINPLDK